MCATLAVSSQSGLEQLSFSYNPSLDFFYSPHLKKKKSPVATVSLDLNFDGDHLSLSSHHICVWSSFIRSAHLKWSQPSLQKPTKIIIFLKIDFYSLNFLFSEKKEANEEVVLGRKSRIFYLKKKLIELESDVEWNVENPCAKGMIV